MKNFRYLLLLSSVSTGFAVPVTMPSAQVLETRLKATIGSHFNTITQLAEELGGTQREPLGVALSLEYAIYDYKNSRSFKDVNEKFPELSDMVEMKRPDILKALLQDSPEAIEELKSKGLLANSNEEN